MVRADWNRSKVHAMQHLPEGHPPVKTGKVGVLLVNLGTPDALGYWPVRRYLSEFLSDRRVIEVSPVVWQPILQGAILSIRPQKSGANYARIWDNEAGDSPLRVITRRQTEKLAERLSGHSEIIVDFAMRYGNPPIEERLKAMHEAGCERILLAPLYPQYSATTTATANDKAFDALKSMRWQPALRTLPPYYRDSTYIDGLANSITEGLAKLDFKPDVVITSYHGMPKEYLEKGDPYYCHCHVTTRLLREKLGWSKDQLMLTFQSRFGRAEWLQPYTDKTLESLPAKGIKKVAILSPAFSSDCIETLEELAITGAEQFEHAGGERYAYIPCLNDTDAGMAMLETVIRRELSGWI